MISRSCHDVGRGRHAGGAFAGLLPIFDGQAMKERSGEFLFLPFFLWHHLLHRAEVGAARKRRICSVVYNNILILLSIGI